MKKIALLLLLAASALSYGQKARVKVNRIAIDSASYATSTIYSLIVDVNKPKVTKNSKVRLANAEIITNHQSNPGWNRNSADDYYDSDYRQEDKITFRISLFPMDTILRKIDTIRGTLNYFEPTLENGGIYTVTNPLSMLGENLVAGVIDDAKVIMLHPATLMNSGSNYEKEVSALEDKHGLSRGAIKQELDTFIAKPPRRGIEDSYLFYITGNSEKIAKIDYLNPEKALMLQVDSFGVKKEDNSHFRFVNFLLPPAPDWKMDIYMETETSVTRYDFVLTDVKMPFKN